MSVLPYKDQKDGKKKQVEGMFNNIAPKYDLLNRLLSAGTDIRWRRKAVRLLESEKPKMILDIATGTGDLAIEALMLDPEKIIGIDISEGMLEVGRQKISRMNLSHKIELRKGDSEDLEFPDNYFDAVIVAFGVRNFENLEKGLAGMFRVLKPAGTLVVLEFSKPRNFIFKVFYNFYSKFIMPFIGRIVSKDKSAYTYLPESVKTFPYGEGFLKILLNTGFHSTKCIPLTFGISSVYTAKK